MDSFREVLDLYKIQNLSLPTNEAETMLLEDIAKIVGIGADVLRMDTPFFSLGFTSMDLIRLLIDVPIIGIMKNPTLSAAIRDLLSDNTSNSDKQSLVDQVSDKTTDVANPTRPASTYGPIVVFNADGGKASL